MNENQSLKRAKSAHHLSRDTEKRLVRRSISPVNENQSPKRVKSAHHLSRDTEKRLVRRSANEKVLSSFLRNKYI